MTYDFVIIGSGFGGSVSALRLVEKGYRVLVLEKGRRFGPEDFPKTNWDLRRWLWMPEHGHPRPLQDDASSAHVTVLHGVGVGGGSLVYANTLPVPKDGVLHRRARGRASPTGRRSSRPTTRPRSACSAPRGTRT